MVEGHDVGAGAQGDVFCARYGLREYQVACGVRLPWRGEMFAHPHFRETELVAPFDDAEVLLDAVRDLSVRRVCRLHEHPVPPRPAPWGQEIIFDAQRHAEPRRPSYP